MSTPSSLIAGDQTWALWTVLLAAAAFGTWAERTRWGAKISGAVIAISTTFVLSNVSVIPVSSGVYDTVWSFFVPLAIPLLLFRANLRKIVRDGGWTLGAFACGATGTVIGAWVAYHTVALDAGSGEVAAQFAGIFAATYVGGSMNYAATAKALGLESGELLTAGVAADNLVMTVYFFILFALPSLPWLRARYPRRQPDVSTTAKAHQETDAVFDVFEVGTALALAAGICAFGYGLATELGQPSLAIMIMTALAVCLATTFPQPLSRLRSADRLGMLLMQIFFATIGASANIRVVIDAGPALFVFAGVILSVHLLFLLVVGWVFRFDLAELVIASNANMGGPTTAAAMAGSKNWGHLVVPAIVAGTLGYALANFVGYAVGTALAT